MTRRYSRRDFIGLALSAAAFPWLACKRSAERVVNFFNWSLYISPKTLPRFTERTGIKVNYEEIADDEEMFAKLRAGVGGYDVVVASDYMIPRMRELGLIDPYPAGALKNLRHIDPKFRATPYDPDNSYTVPYMWGTTGIGYNRGKVKSPPQSWWALWDESYRGKISMLDNARDNIATALLLKGYPETTTDPKAFADISEMLSRQRPLVKQYSSGTYIDNLITGEISLAMSWSGDVLQAARENPQLDYVIPKEGSYLWVDNLLLVRGGPNREEALQLIDFLLEPEVNAEITSFVRYASPNASARKLLDPGLLSDPRVFPPASVMKRLRIHALLPPETTQLWNQTWSDIKLG
ncbi:MAG: spermidine/putrescine ABC transporter substrate-binding protein [Elusimicrobia bacterium]|nr:spermidine/putrescine ABC transporter substrate-binding protein [Elusimicrobiota bacterium]